MHVYCDLYLLYTPAVPYGNHGCQGGNMYLAFLYVISNEGVDTQSSYPFKGKVQVYSSRSMNIVGHYNYARCQ